MVKIVLGGLQFWARGQMQPVLDWAVTADRMGVDGITLTDHVVMGENISAYPYGPFPGGPDGPWEEPIVYLSAIAALTRQIRLATGILIAPLRPSALLAKQLATLDLLSNGRLDIGVGVGWQKEEYEAAGVPWEGRFGRLEEQMEVCQLLWRDAPASFHGKYHDFDNIYCRPAPVQAGGVPVWFGLAPTEANIARIARRGIGWMPMEQDPEKLGEPIAAIRQAFAAIGRDPSTLQVRAGLRVLDSVEESLAQIPALAAAGVTHVEVRPARMLKSFDEYEPFLERVLQCR